MTGTALSVLRVACFLLGIYLYQSSGGSSAFIGLFLGSQGILELGLLLGPQGEYGLSWLAVGCVVITCGSFLLVSICAALAALVQRVVPRRRMI